MSMQNFKSIGLRSLETDYECDERLLTLFSMGGAIMPPPL